LQPTDDSTTGSDEDDEEMTKIGRVLYPKLTASAGEGGAEEEQPMPNIRLDRTKTQPEKGGNSRAEGEGLINYNNGNHPPAVEGPKWRKLVPSFLQRNTGRTESQRKAIREQGCSVFSSVDCFI
jgi:hypothetical protein